MPADPKPMLPRDFLKEAESFLNEITNYTTDGYYDPVDGNGGVDPVALAKLLHQVSTRPHAPATQPGRVDLLELLDQAQERQKELEKALADLLDCHLRGTHGFPLHTELIFAIEEQAQAALKSLTTQAQEEKRGCAPECNANSMTGSIGEDGLRECNCKPAPTDEGKEE